MDRMTSNGLLMNIQPLSNGQRVRTLADPKSQQIVSQTTIEAPSLRSKAVKRRKL